MPSRPARPARLTLGVATATVAALATVAGLTVAGLASDGRPRAAGAANVSRLSTRLGQASADQPGGATADGAAAGHIQASGRPPARRATGAPAAKAAAAATPATTATTRPANAAAKPAAPAHRQPYQIYDSVIPQAIPAGKQVATYADGAHPPPASSVAGRHNVLWIDVTGGDPAAQAIDVEPGCASPAAAAAWARTKLSTQPGAVAIIYTTISQWAAVRAYIVTLPAAMQARVRWWIADPTGVPHLVPGSQATQWYWGPSYDISLATWQF